MLILMLLRPTAWDLACILPTGSGGIHIQEWARGTVFCQRMIHRAKAALISGGKIGVVLWYQGESNTVEYEDACSYVSRLESLIIGIRADLELPHLPFIQVASGDGPYLNIVRKVQKGVRLPDVNYVDALGLKLQSDHIHLTTQAQVQPW